MTHTPQTSSSTSWLRRFSRFRLRWLLMLFIPSAIALTIYSRREMQRHRIANAYDRINRVGFNANFAANGNCILYARSANITDNDLKALIPIGNGEAGMGSDKVIRIDLHGSNVSDEAIAEFRQSAPECELVR